MKVDNKKTYNFVTWKFSLLYDELLPYMGHMDKRVVNESPIEKFKPTKGLRHDHPLASFLFLIVPERLVRLVR